MTSIGTSSFSGCSNLKSFYYKGTTNPTFESDSFYNTEIDKIYLTKEYEHESFANLPVTLHPSLITQSPALTPTQSIEGITSSMTFFFI